MATRIGSNEWLHGNISNTRHENTRHGNATYSIWMCFARQQVSVQIPFNIDSPHAELPKRCPGLEHGALGDRTQVLEQLVFITIQSCKYYYTYIKFISYYQSLSFKAGRLVPQLSKCNCSAVFLFVCRCTSGEELKVHPPANASSGLLSSHFNLAVLGLSAEFVWSQVASWLSVVGSAGGGHAMVSALLMLAASTHIKGAD